MINLILVGCGAVSQQFYLPALRTLSAARTVRVTALVDPNAKARDILAAAFPEAQLADTLADVNAPANSLAVIATPPRFHAPQTLEAFAKNWHVLCEKPMASTAAECEQMIAAARASNRLLAVGLYKRFFPFSQIMKQLCAPGGQLGPLRSYTIAEGGPFRWPAASPSFFQKSQTPGGVLLDIGVHVLDLLLWWLGEPTSFAYADDAMGGLETNSKLQLQHAGGATGRLHLSRDWQTPNRYRFIFERGEISWQVNDANQLTLQLTGLPFAQKSQLLSSPTQPAATNAQSFIAQLQNVCAAIETKAPLLIPGEEGLRSLRLIETCYAQKTLLAQPWLTDAEAAKAAQTVVGNS